MCQKIVNLGNFFAVITPFQETSPRDVILFHTFKRIYSFHYEIQDALFENRDI